MQEVYKTEIAPVLKKELGIDNVNAIPKVVKIVVSVGVGKLSKDSKMLETVESTLTRITGQKPAQTRARVSISNFKLREGMVVGYKVTLRGARMWDFLQKLVHITFAFVISVVSQSSTLMTMVTSLSVSKISLRFQKFAMTSSKLYMELKLLFIQLQVIERVGKRYSAHSGSHLRMV
jgi:hypothetical protein